MVKKFRRLNMVRIECRRQADPQMVKRLWEAITFIRNQKQVANNERIQKYMQRQYGTSETDCMTQVSYASVDALLFKEMSTGKKGSRVGMAQEAFWCVDDTKTESQGSHDWYCFTCHKPGKVWCCDTCHRVYHPQCLDDDKEGIEGEKWSCAACLSLKRDNLQINKGTLYRLLDFVLARMKDKARELHRKLKLSLVPNYYNLVYRHVDLGNIMEDVESKEYKSINEFELSAQDMMHTSAVYYGNDSDRASLSQLTLNDCRYDLAEIRLCVDCYLASNNKVRDDWFCTPCSPVHELAWVHMKGFGCWPAKILHKNEGKVDVRFFGKKHERALVPEGDVKPIDTDLKELRIKKSKGWDNACKELDHHKVLVELGVTPVRDEVGEDDEEEKPLINGKEGKTPGKRGTKRKLDQCEAEELVKKTHSDAGQVNSISTSQEEQARDGTTRPKKKRRKSKAPAPKSLAKAENPGPPPQESPAQEAPALDPQDFDAPDVPMEDDESSVQPKGEKNDEAEPAEDEDAEGEGWKEEGVEEDGWEKDGSGSSKKENEHPKVKKEGAKTKKGGEQKGKKEGSKKAAKESGGKPVKEEETASGGAKSKGKKGKSAGGSSGHSKSSGGISGMEEDDFEMKYRQKLADYKAHQEMEFQARIEKTVEEAVAATRKRCELERTATDAGTIVMNEELIEEARREEGDRLKEEHAGAISQLKEKHKEEISQTKKRQWARKRCELERTATDAGTIAMNEELIEEARREEGARLKEEHDRAISQLEEKHKEEQDRAISQLKEKHKEEISQSKKRQWCINCEQEAMYHCCWNTSYCSISCQQIHWHKEHKRVCRRRR